MTLLTVDLDRQLATLLRDLGRTHTEESVAYDTAGRLNSSTNIQIKGLNGQLLG
jgi:hypothetical protein